MLTIEEGPRRDAPLDLLKTWKPSLTIWTYWVAPTSPSVSGGAQLQATPGNGMPLKLRMGAGMASGAMKFCTTESFTSLWALRMAGLVLASCSGPGTYLT